MSAATLDRDRAALVVVDVQEAFRPAVDGFAEVAASTATLVRGAQLMGVPVVTTEQYPRGLGRTVPEVAEHLEGAAPLEKTAFSAARAAGFTLGGREQAIVCGVEAHVCVAQTVLDLLAQGVQVQVPADGVASRRAADRDAGLRRMEQAGATLSCTEMVLFELLGSADAPEFKAVQGLVK